MLQSLSSSVRNEELHSPHTVILISPKHAAQDCSSSVALCTEELKPMKSSQIFQKWCMHEESFAPHEGKGYTLNSLSLCLCSTHPLTLLFLCADLLSSCCAELHGMKVFAGVSAAAQKVLSRVCTACNWQKRSS